MLIRFELTIGDTISVNPAAVSSVTQWGFGGENHTAKIHMINRDTHYVKGSIDEVTDTLNNIGATRAIKKPKTNPTPIRTAAKRK